MTNDRFKKNLDAVILSETKNIFRIGFIFAPVLFLGFFAIDILIYPKEKWTFLFLRTFHFCAVILLSVYFRKNRSLASYQYAGLIWSILASSIITYMISITDGPSSIYYAGLNLVALLSIFFIPYNSRVLTLSILGIYSPYIFVSLYHFKVIDTAYFAKIITNLSFCVGTVLIGLLIRKIGYNIRKSEVIANLNLALELENREEVIRIKTDEAVKLTHLSSQFSPQIVESIRQGKIDLDSSGQRAEICSIFIDIVNSTERVTRIDKDKVEKVLSRFLDDSIKILLKYDITIDKFLGDGVLGFCNAPLKRKDYTSRVLHAALEIRDKINQDASFYERYWQHALEVRVGIAKGFANVGFYGSQKYYKSYTAIGPVVNLASRLCSSANPMQIIVDNDVFEVVQHDFDMNFLGKKSLKGFGDDLIHAYEVIGPKVLQSSLTGQTDCKTCGTLLSLETDQNGHFIFMCKTCCEVIHPTTEDTPNLETRKVA